MGLLRNLNISWSKEDILLKYIKPEMEIIRLGELCIVTTSQEIDNITEPENPDIGW